MKCANNLKESSSKKISLMNNLRSKKRILTNLRINSNKASINFTVYSISNNKIIQGSLQ